MLNKVIVILFFLFLAQLTLAEKVQHPLANQGLLKIQADGTYIYKTPSTTKTQSMNFHVGTIQPFNIVANNGAYDFSDIYGSSIINTFQFDYEWVPFTSLGKLGVQLGFGLFSVYGQGRFANDTKTEARETYTFYGMPLSAGIVYRFQYFPKQWIAPYIAAGGIYYGLFESRDDGVSNGVGTPGAYGSGGVLFNISSFDRETAIILDSEYGISNLWFLLEYRKIIGANTSLDISGDFISAGVTVDY